MREIQVIALDLFDKYGFPRVTVGQIAEAAGVSASSIYRYFGTKEMVVLWDEITAINSTIELGDSHVLHVLHSASSGSRDISEILERVQPTLTKLIENTLVGGDEALIERRMRLVASEPDVRAAQMKQTERFEIELRDVLTTLLQRDPHDDLDIRLAAAQLSWSFHAAIDYWVARDFDESLSDVLTIAVSALIRGLSAQFPPR